MMDIIQINRDTCSRCGICALVCGPGVIHFTRNNFPRPALDAEEECLRCSHCVIACPTGSLMHREIPLEQCGPLPQIPAITAEQCQYLLQSRRSVRVYNKKKVSRVVITRLIEMMRYTPTGHNNQSLQWLVIDSREELERIRNAGIEWLRWNIRKPRKSAPPINYSRILQHEENGYDELFRHTPVIIIAHGDKNNPLGVMEGSIALAYLNLAADVMGLGCCWCGFMSFMAGSFAPMQQCLKLPAGNKLYACMLLGYPRVGYYRLPLRRQPHIDWR
jgi:nitroreductase/NAD-dependent dihydropyrimidine dehydrogenase PreA subunit